MSPPTSMMISLLLTTALCSACAEEEQTTPSLPLTVTAAKMRASEIRGKVVSGELMGREFTARSVCLHVIRCPGHERVDLILSEIPITKCGIPGQPVDDRSSRVWIRLLDKNNFVRGEHRIEPDTDGPLRAHFEVFNEDHWRGFGRAAALLSVDEVAEGALIGRLKACFDDGWASCVEGRFLAKECRSAIDIDMLGERYIREEVERQ